MIRPPRTEDDLRCAVEECLQKYVSDDAWGVLKEEGYVGNYFEPGLSSKERERRFSALVDAANLTLRLIKPRYPRLEREDKFQPAPAEAEVIITSQVQEAKQHPDLVYLWKEVFRGRLAQPGQEEEFLATFYENSEVSLAGLHLFISNLAKEFSQKYGWTLSSARRFILTGQMPYISKFRMKFNRNEAYLALSTVTIEASLLMNPRELAKAFGEFQRLLLNFYGMARSTKRKRPLSEKHRKLAEFATQYQHLSAAEALKKWNALYPDWAYSQVTNFQRDRKAALRRLFGQSMEQPPPPDL